MKANPSEPSPGIKNTITGFTALLALGLFFYFSPLLASAWQPSPSAPPDGNVETPLNATTTGQTKQGNLALNTGGAFANALLIPYGNVGLGTNSPSQKLQVHGQVYSSTGGFRFPDNTVQTTAMPDSRIPCNWPNGWDFSCAAGGMPRVFCENGYATQISMTPVCTAGGSGGGSSPGGGGQEAFGSYTEANTYLGSEWGYTGIGQNPGGGSSCFLPGTKISIAYGKSKNIEDVAIGDIVLGYDPITETYTANTVLELESPIREDYYIISFNNNTELRITDEHPIYTSKGWSSILPEKTLLDSSLKVESLAIGDSVFNESEEWQTIKEITHIKGSVQTYNLKKLSGSNTFFADGVLAHNKTDDGGGGGPDTSCFAADTKILKADKKYSDINDINVGDKVVAYNIQTKQRELKEVTRVFEHDYQGVLLTINGHLKVTPEHVIKINGEWKNIGKAKIGDKLEDKDGKTVIITSVSQEEFTGKVYNLSVKDDRTYYANDILVHNFKN